MINFNVPSELISQEPVNPRDSARLLVYDRQTRQITDAIFRDLIKFLPQQSTLAINNSKVENCRWLFNDSKIEIFVIEKLDTNTIRALVKPGKKFKLEKQLKINEWLTFHTVSIDKEGIRTLKLSVNHDDKRLKKFEHVPLPPYITQNDKLANEYQTVYAKPLGSKAAPTAGLHFTDKLLNEIKKHHELAEVTLHVGLGTFGSLTEENFNTGKLHEEYFSIKEKELKKLKNANHITAVGTTTARTLESTVQGPSLYRNVSGFTDIFIQPGYEFKAVDSLITNFHLPGTSLLLMVEAFIGSKLEMQKIYNHALKNSYRFYSFGDAMLVL